MHVIAVDAMGGDNAPQAIVEGVNQALAEFKDIEIQLYGDEAKIKNYLTANERVSIVHTDEKINSDDEPVKAIRKKKKASMVLGTQAVKDDMKRKLRQFIDELYDNYVGIHLKSKKFIDNLNSWGHIMSKEDSAD